MLRPCAIILILMLILAGTAGRGATAVQSLPAVAAASPHASPAGGPQRYTLPPEKLAKARVLGWIRPAMYFAGSLLECGLLFAFLATGLAVKLESWCGRRIKRRWLQGLLYFSFLHLGLWLAMLPLSVFGHAVSLHYGISVQGWGGWMLDVAKAMGIFFLPIILLLLFCNWLVRRSPRRYWLWLWAITVPLMILGALVEPLGEPLFNHFEPLAKSHPELVAKLEEVAARTGERIPPERIYLMQASVRTNALNAYVTGLGKTKRIVVWDTTAGRIPDDEILFIFGHESGHYVLHHIPKGLALAAISLLPFYWICAQVAGCAVRRWGARRGFHAPESRAGFVLLLLVALSASFLADPANNLVSRYFEHQADVYGQEAIHGIVADPRQSAVNSFIHLGEAVLDDPDPNPLIEFWSYSHPSLQHRVQFAAQYDPWRAGQKARFF